MKIIKNVALISEFNFNVFAPQTITTDLRIFYISNVCFMIERFYSQVLITFIILFYL